MLRPLENQGSVVVPSLASPYPDGDRVVAETHPIVWVALALGLSSVVAGFVLGLLGLPLGIAAAGAGVAALVRLHNLPPQQGRGEMLALLSLACGVFQVVFAVVGLYALGAG